MHHRLMTAAAALAGGTALANTAPAAAPPAAGAAPAAGEGDPVDVITVADAQTAVANARIEGATAERDRTSKVFASDEGKANPQMAAFMLSSNPAATSDAIVAHLKTMPAASAAAPAPAPAATTTTAAPAAAAPAPAPTADLTKTPLIVVDPDANTGGDGGTSEVDSEKFWSTQMSSASLGKSPFGADLSPGLPRTGN